MACRGVHFALTSEELAALRRCPTDEERLELLQEEIEETLFDAAPDRVCETDKAWDAIHRCLTDGTLYGEVEPGCFAILGGEQLYDDEDYIMALKTPERVQAVSAHLGSWSEQTFREAYDRIDPDDYDGALGDQDFEYTWTWFEGLRTFFSRAAASGHHVLFTVDQ